MDPTADTQLLEQTLFEVKEVIVGQDRLVERLMTALLAGGHCLLEGVPGVAKTLAAETLAVAVRTRSHPPGGRGAGLARRRAAFSRRHAGFARCGQPAVVLPAAIRGRERRTGLGLAIVRQIVESHGGQVAAYSTLGVGGTFVLWLPATDRTGELPPPAASPWPRTGS